MEASSNSRDGLSLSTTTITTSLQLSVEQWELLRRLRNSHLTKVQIIRAYDELDRLDRELGNLFNSASFTNSFSSNNLILNDPVSPSTLNIQQISPPSSISTTTNNKRSHTNGLSSGKLSNGYPSSHVHHSTSNINVRSIRSNINDTNSTQHDTINSNDIEEENRELQELLAYVDKRDNGIFLFFLNRKMLCLVRFVDT